MSILQEGVIWFSTVIEKIKVEKEKIRYEMNRYDKRNFMQGRH
jgi:hypothetical protein